MQATSHYLNRWWSVFRRIYPSHGLNDLNLTQWVISGSGNDSSPIRQQDISWTTDDSLAARPMGNKLQPNFNQNTAIFFKMHFKYHQQNVHHFIHGAGVGVTKAPFVNFAITENFGSAKIQVRYLKSRSLSSGISAAYLSNMNVILYR